MVVVLQLRICFLLPLHLLIQVDRIVGLMSPVNSTCLATKSSMLVVVAMLVLIMVICLLKVKLEHCIFSLITPVYGLCIPSTYI